MGGGGGPDPPPSPQFSPPPARPNHPREEKASRVALGMIFGTTSFAARPPPATSTGPHHPKVERGRAGHERGAAEKEVIPKTLPRATRDASPKTETRDGGPVGLPAPKNGDDICRHRATLDDIERFVDDRE